MEFSICFASHAPGKRDELGKALAEFREEALIFEPKTEYEKIYENENGEIFLVKAECQSPAGNAENGQERDALARSLMAHALTHRFIPIDSDGNQIFLTPPYGFDVILYSQRPGRETDLRKIVLSLGNEIPGHEGTFNIQSHKPQDEEGEYYMVSVRFQDYWTEKDRYRLQLAFYLRLLMLCARTGMEAVVTGNGG